MAYHLHWDYETIMNMEHNERKQWCEEVSKINKKMNTNKTKSLLDV